MGNVDDQAQRAFEHLGSVVAFAFQRDDPAHSPLEVALPYDLARDLELVRRRWDSRLLTALVRDAIAPRVVVVALPDTL